MQKKDDSTMIMAVVLIAVGMLWLLRQLGDFPLFTGLHFHHLFTPFRHMFSGIGSILFSWQLILIITGIILIAGRRSAGIVLVALGSIFLLYQNFSHSPFLLFIPHTCAVGWYRIALIVKASLKIN
jgi:hypothetical protein